MGMTVLKIRFANISQSKSLRMNTSFYNKEELGNKQVEQLGKNFKLIRLSEITLRVTQGLSVHLEDSERQGKIGILTIENVDDNSVNVLPPHGFLPYIPEKGILDKGCIITPRVRKIGNFALIQDNDSYVASENVLVLELDGKKLEQYSLKLDFVAIFLSFIGKNQLRLLRTGGEAGNINHWLLQEMYIPLVSISQQATIIEEIRKILDLIEDKRKTITSLQSIIDEKLVDDGIKSSQQCIPKARFSSKLSDIGQERQLRCGALYRWFWDVNHGMLFDYLSENYGVIELGSVISKYKAMKENKGVLSRDYLLVELDDVEQGTGRILNERLVSEVGSEKVVFGESDILTSKLRPYLGYTILNDKGKDLIGTTEFVPFKTKRNVLPEFVKYLFLSDDFLMKSMFLMYGKEHPRIHVDDILRIKIPNVPDAVQEHVVHEIQNRETENNIKRDSISELKLKAELLVLKTLGLD
jgi:restriction endonuclease S subunit